MNSLTTETALRAFAAMMNTLDASRFEHLLAEDFHYSSQFVFAEIETKTDYLAYINPKLQSIRSSNSKIWAEMGELVPESPGPCVIVAQGHKDDLVGVVLATVRNNLIQRIDFCFVPSPQSAIRGGEYPK